MARLSYIFTPKKIRKDLSKERKELEAEVADAKNAAKHLPKEFNYYCPSCLYQTKEDTGRCPKCGASPLKKTE